MGVQFWSDRRAVSEVLGAVLLLGILMIALTSYQAVLVPSQNAQTEFQHNLQVENEMVDLRNAILEARSSGTQTFASITLGTQFRDRIVAINPPPASGSLQTVQQDNISVVEGSGADNDPLGLDDRPLENQFIEYTPRYFEYRSAGTMRYENTVLYHQYPDGNVTLTNQRLLSDDRVTLAPIEGTINENGVQRVTVDPIPGVLQTTDVEDPEISLPTKLSESDWTEILDEELSSGESLSVDDGVLTLTLSGTYEIAYSPVGANRPPREKERGESAGEINPASPGNVQLVGAQWDGSSVRLSFRNSADDSSFTSGRLNFFFGNSDPDEVVAVNALGAGSNPRGENWAVGGDFRDLDPDILLEGDGSITEVEYVFDQSVNRNQDFFVTTLTLESGERATYFVGGEFSADDEDDNNGNGASDDNGDDAPSFNTLTASSSSNTVTFGWDVSGDFDQVSLSTETDSVTSSDRSGSETLDKQSGNRDITAVVEGSEGTETCEATIGNNANLDKDDFTCTTT